MKLNDALAEPNAIAYAGRTWVVKPLTFAGLAKIERKYGSLDALNMNSIADQIWVMWLVLSGSNSSVTEDEVGEMLPITDPEGVAAFIGGVFKAAGLSTSEKNEVAPEADKAPAPARKTSRA